MTKCYWIGHIDVRDVEGFGCYVELARPALQRFGARFLVLGDEPFIAEGRVRSRHFVIEFQDENLAMFSVCRIPEGQALPGRIFRYRLADDFRIRSGLIRNLAWPSAGAAHG